LFVEGAYIYDARAKYSSQISEKVQMQTTRRKLASVLLVVKATALKQQMSKFCLQIQHTEANYRIYHSGLSQEGQ